MEQFKKAKVVMLPTNEKAGLGSIYKRIKDDEIGLINDFDKIGNLYINKNPNVQSSNSNFEAQHLYIILDEEIKEGDWYKYEDWSKGISLLKGGISNAPISNCGSNFVNSRNPKKIIATTDPLLKIEINGNRGNLLSDVSFDINLPQPSKQFIEKYIEEYNKGNVITDILVEYEYLLDDRAVLPYWNLKINPKDNTITIKKLKETYTKEELCQILEKYTSFIWSEVGIHYPISLGNSAKEKFINLNL